MGVKNRIRHPFFELKVFLRRYRIDIYLERADDPVYHEKTEGRGRKNKILF